MIIYKAENIINGKCYIGKTIQNFDRYKNQHLSDAKTNRYPNRYFHRGLRKYGKEKFQWNILWEGNCGESWLNELEKYYIYFHGSCENGYNMTKGGDGAEFGENNAFCKLSPEKRMETILKGNKKRIRFRHSEETKKKMSKTRSKMYKGRNNPLAKTWVLYSPSNKYIVKDGLLNFCNEMNISFALIRKSIKLNKKVAGWRALCQSA